MAGSVNKVILVGHLGADPEIRRSQAGNLIVSLRVATSEQWRDKATGERREKTEWHNVVVFQEAAAKFAEQYLRKGAKVYVEGALQTRKWQDNQGNDRWSTEVVLQGFACALKPLDRAQGTGYQPGGDGAEDYGIDPGRAAGPSSSPAGAGRAADEDIPL